MAANPQGFAVVNCFQNTNFSEDSQENFKYELC